MTLVAPFPWFGGKRRRASHVWRRFGEVPNYVEPFFGGGAILLMLIPKVVGGIPRLPRRIGGRDVVLGYSAATSYGGTALPIWEFAGWPVHILGGNPHRQMTLWRYLSTLADVVSVDGNVAQKMAKFCCVWVPGTAINASKSRWWPTLRELGDERRHDAPYEAFRRSAANIVDAWGRLCGGEAVG